MAFHGMIKMYMYLIIIVCLLVCDHILCENIIEGDVVKLDFPFPCDSTKVTLQLSNRRPFYRSANPEHDALMPSSYELRNHTDSKSDSCYLSLTINPVSRDDEGTFILIAYKDGQMLPEFPRIGLRVVYPPGKASCESSDEHVDGEWVKLHCQAPVGTLSGEIVCYQDDMRLPSLASPGKNDETLNQIILARLAGLVYCCTSTFQQIKDRCECNDFRWNPILNVELSNISHPCAAATTMADSATSFILQDQEVSTIHPNASDRNKCKNTHNSRTRGFYVFITFICLMALSYFALPIRCLYKARQKKKQLKKQSDPINEDEQYERIELKETA